MLTIRRVYLYLILAAGLGTLASGAVQLLRSLLLLVVGQEVAGGSLSQDFVMAGALLIVGLPVWAGHWWYATRLAGREPAERQATLRRFYLYLVLAVAGFVAAIPGAYDTVKDFLFWLTGGSIGAYQALDGVPLLLVGAVGWAYHWQVTAAERRLDGEVDESATIRRWYVYGYTAVALQFLLIGSARLIELLWRDAFQGPAAGLASAVAAPAASALVALPLWLLHWRWANLGPTAADDRRSVLRTFYLLVMLGIAVAVTLVQVSQVLYYGLSRLLGVERPGGTDEPLLVLLGGPIGWGLVYGAAWYYHRRVLNAETAAYPDSAGRLGVRRLYRYLVVLVSITVFSVGLAQLLWVLGDAITGAFQPSPDWWQREVSAGATALVVGLLTWLGHWRPVVEPAEAHSLSRRLYVYLTLIGAVLACLIAGVSFVYELLNLVTGIQLAQSALANLTRALGVVLTGGGVAYYHWRALRLDQRAIAAAPPEPAPGPPATALLTLTAPDGRVLRQISASQAILEQAMDRVFQDL